MIELKLPYLARGTLLTVNETSSSQAKEGISYSPECHFWPHVSVLFQPAVEAEDPQLRLWPTGFGHH